MARATTKAMYESLVKKELTMQDVSLIMSEVRKLIDENEVWRKKLRLLHFYCDWCQHDKIDQNPESVQVIADMNRCLWQLDKDGVHNAAQPMDVAGFLRLSQLVREFELVLSAVFVKQIVPTQTFLYSLFRFLKGIPVVPVDAEYGRLAHSTKEYEQLCNELYVCDEHPLIKNLVITEVGDNAICYQCNLDGVKTTIQGIIDFPFCTSYPFEISELGSIKTDELEPWRERWNKVQELLHSGSIQDAYAMLQQMHEELVSVSGMDVLRNDINLMCFKVGWSFTGDPSVFKYGEVAAETTTDVHRAAIIYHNLSKYALQKNMLPESQTYMNKCMECAVDDADKGSAYQQKGCLLSYQKDYDGALTAFLDAEKYAQWSHQTRVIIRTIINATDVWCAKGMPQTAISELERALQLAFEIRELDDVIRCMVRKAQVYYTIGQKGETEKVITHIPKQID